MRMYFDKNKALPVIPAGLNLGVFRYRLTPFHISSRTGTTMWLSTHIIFFVKTKEVNFESLNNFYIVSIRLNTDFWLCFSSTTTTL